ncbi:Os10g0455800, partial [Oryza sativa Japonica Group]
RIQGGRRRFSNEDSKHRVKLLGPRSRHLTRAAAADECHRRGLGFVSGRRRRRRQRHQRFLRLRLILLEWAARGCPGFMGGTAVVIMLQQLKGFLGRTYFTTRKSPRSSSGPSRSSPRRSPSLPRRSPMTSGAPLPSARSMTAAMDEGRRRQPGEKWDPAAAARTWR